MTTFNEILKKYEFTDFEDDDGPIISSMFHKDDVVKAIQEWLTQKLQEREPDIKESKQPNTIRNRQYWNGYELAFSELLEDFAFNNRKETEESK